jgi:hypothetical protein
MEIDRKYNMLNKDRKEHINIRKIKKRREGNKNIDHLVHVSGCGGEDAGVLKLDSTTQAWCAWTALC